MNDAQKKVFLAIQKKEKELAELKEKERQINKKAAEKEKRAEEIRIRKLGRRVEEALKGKYGNRYFETTSLEEILEGIGQLAEDGGGVWQPAPPALPERNENGAEGENL